MLASEQITSVPRDFGSDHPPALANFASALKLVGASHENTLNTCTHTVKPFLRASPMRGHPLVRGHLITTLLHY